MVRGTTAQFQFKLPYNYSDLSLAKIVFWQPGNDGPSKERPLPIVKVLQQCSTSGNPNEIFITLSEEETLRFSEKTKAYVQLLAKSKDGNTFASKKEVITVYPVHDDNILGDEVLPTPTDDGWVILDGFIVL